MLSDCRPLGGKAPLGFVSLFLHDLLVLLGYFMFFVRGGAV